MRSVCVAYALQYYTLCMLDVLLRVVGNEPKAHLVELAQRMPYV
jgi:hypothetical protein